MSSKKATISITNVDKDEDANTTPRARIAMPRGSPKSFNGSASKAYDSPVATYSSPCAQPSSQFLCPATTSEDAYLTPTNMRQDNSVTSQDARYQRAMAAPKKREEMLETSARKGRAYDPDNLSIREFKLSPRSSDGDNSTENSSDNGHGRDLRQKAMNDLRGQWSAFTERIMAVEIPSKPQVLRA